MPDSNIEGDIGEIKRKQIEDAWYERKPLRQIADETGLPIEVVNRIAKHLGKELVSGRVQRHGEQGHF